MFFVIVFVLLLLTSSMSRILLMLKEYYLLVCNYKLCFTFLVENALFDASQYSFFGQDAMEEVELGGMEDEENEVPVTGYGDDEYHLFDREEVRLDYDFNLAFNLIMSSCSL